ncbi:LacI family transcriptional regulator [Microlunatus elymi]|uniref:LacI family transcriptional regulator n=1 Tax=Microlunatus elymi TaxID=2596828 RepID=A0A516PTX9_9ACTN|nr:LacI family DNA-binding transcriptional regulator [Microlunatus elymi]QDP94638.1 LacI family transcriptional regulator [Microlunatus elymi]
MAIQNAAWSPRSEQFYNRLLVGLEDELVAQAHGLLIKIVSDRDEELSTLRQWARDGAVQGVVCKDIAVGDDFEASVQRTGLAYAILGDSSQLNHANLVAVNNADGMRRVLDHLIAGGRHEIDWISGPQRQLHTHVRLGVFEQYRADGRILGQAAEADYDVDRCLELITAALQRDVRPRAFLLDGEDVGIRVLERIRELGFSVPGDVALMCWDDSLTCQRADPPITALNHHVEELGRSVGRCLVAAAAGRLLHETAPDLQIVARASTD